MKILYLYAEVMDYTIATIEALKNNGAEIHVVHWDKKKLTPFKIKKLTKVSFYCRSNLSLEKMYRLVDNLKPDITVVSGWMDKNYLSIARYLRKNDLKVVCCLDQHLGPDVFKYISRSLVGISGFLLRYFSHAWVAGVYQYEYARKIGFKKENIIFDLLSANTSKFNYIYKKKYPHRFLFLGRFDRSKNINLLLKAWTYIKLQRKDWKLYLIGGSNLKKNYPNVVIKNFIQPDNLNKELAKVGCAILPSRFEPWGVVVHEFASAGIPMILSDEVGSRATFLINKWNGFIFKSNNIKKLADCMLQIIESSDQELKKMAKRSIILSKRISPETSASNLLGIN